MSDSQLPNLQVSDDGRIVTIFGIRYDIEIFRHLGLGPLGQRFEVVNREDGCVWLKTLSNDTAADSLPMKRLQMIADAAKDGASLTWIRAVAEEGLRGEPLAEIAS